MGEEANRIVEEIEAARQDLDHDLAVFEARIREETSPKVQVQRHPWFVAGVAVALGFLVYKLIRW
jgi:hypothetical protein